MSRSRSCRIRPRARGSLRRRIFVPEAERQDAERPQARRIHFICARSAEWAAAMLARGWLLADAHHAPDVVVCSGSGLAETMSRFHGAGIVQVLTRGEPCVEGGDVAVFDPTLTELSESCERALVLARARRMPLEELVDILECMEDALFVLGWDQRVVYQNRQALGFVASAEGGDGDILGDGLADHLPPILHGRLSPLVRDVLRDAEPRRAEIEDGPRWIEASVYFVPAGVAIGLRDITKRRATGASDAAGGDA